jgi:hypothetical protein
LLASIFSFAFNYLSFSRGNFTWFFYEWTFLESKFFPFFFFNRILYVCYTLS